MLAFMDEPATASESPNEQSPQEAAAQQAYGLLSEGRPADARRLIEEAAQNHGVKVALLWPLAHACFDEGDLVQALAHLDDAVKLEPADPNTIAQRIRILSARGLRRQALLAIDEIPAEMEGDDQLRKTVGRFYLRCGCLAHALMGLGAPFWPPLKRPRPSLLAIWLMRIGPALMRQRIRRWEEKELLDPLRATPPRWANLSADAGVTGSDLIRLRAALDELLHGWGRRYEYWHALMRWQRRLLPGAALPVWLVLWATAALLPVGDRLAALALPSVGSSAIAMSIAWVAYATVLGRRLWWRTRTRHVALTTAIVIGIGAATAEGFVHHVLPASGWQFWVFYGLLAAPVVAICVFASGSVMEDLTRRSTGAALKQRVDINIIDDLLIVLDRMRAPGARAPSASMSIAASLDLTAYWIELDLLPSKDIGDGSRQWLEERTEGWAHALRLLAREAIAPVPGSQLRVERALCHEIHCLAKGDLGALSWKQPPPPPPPGKRRWDAITAALRAILVAALPLAAVLASQPLLDTGSDTFRWTRIATGVWALLYLLLYLDPTIGDKIDTARRVIGTVNDAKSTNKPTGPQT